MATLGIRASNNEIHYAVCSGTLTEPSVDITEKLVFPKSMSEPERLSWLREEFLNVCGERGIDAVFIKAVEPNVRTITKSLIERFRVEGVLVESARSRGFNISIGPYATLSSLIGTRMAKSYVTGDQFRGIEKWASLNEKSREASIAGIAALGLS